jgi:GH43 family beta-xylosidase
MLTYNGNDPLNADSWVKHPEPVFERVDSAGVYGPGHATFFSSPDGTEDWIAYHANDEITDGCDMGRTPRIQRFSWHEDGTPDFGSPVSTTEELPVPSGE